MTKRYRITVHLTDDGDDYDIEHEADEVLLDIGSRLYFGDPAAKLEWAPYAEIWPALLDIEENEDGAPGFEILEYFEDDPDLWPGRLAFWNDARHAGVAGVGHSSGGVPGGSELLRIEGAENLDAVMDALRDKYEFVGGEPWV